MLSPHTSVSIAQCVFYLPIVPTVFFILIRNWHNRPRMPWYPLCLFSLMRLAGGIVVIVQGQGENQYNTGLIVAALILLNVGLIPLIISSFGLVRLLLGTERNGETIQRKATKVFRISIIIAVALLSSGGALTSNPDVANIGRILEEVGYIIFSCLVLGIIGMLLVMLGGVFNVLIEERVYLHGALLAMPFLAIRAAYGLLYVFGSSSLDSIWNPLFGNSVAFALMALLPEYIVLMIYVYLGFHRIHSPPPQNSVQGPESVKHTFVEV